MHAHAMFRIFLVAFAFALLSSGVGLAPATAKEKAAWTNTTKHENVLVQSCSDFDITGSYTTVRSYQVFKGYANAGGLERRDVTFTGTIVNAASGKGFGFDGGFTREAGYGSVVISDLNLNFDLPHQGVVSVAIDREARDVIDDPVAILLEFAPFAYRNGLCDLLGSSSSASPQVPTQQLLDPCLNMPRGKPC